MTREVKIVRKKGAKSFINRLIKLQKSFEKSLEKNFVFNYKNDL